MSVPFCRDRISKGGRDLVFMKVYLIVNDLQNLETKVLETIYFELSIILEKWRMLFAYKPPKQREKFIFHVIFECLNEKINSY